MHELSIALSIVEGAEEELQRQGAARVCAVHLRLGPLSGVVKDALRFSYEVACQGTSLEGSRLEIEDVPVLVFCPACQAARSPVSIQRLQCATCQTVSDRVVQGGELELRAIEIQ